MRQSQTGTSFALAPFMLSGTETSLPSRAIPPVDHMSAPSPKVVAIGGGTGLPAVLRGFRFVAETGSADGLTDWLTAVVTVMDDGGSSGQLRKSLGVLPPGDVRNCLSALVRTPSSLSGILHDRLSGTDEHSGHPIGNLLLAALTSMEGDFLRAVTVLGARMNVSGRVLPATLENVHLTAAFDDGCAVRGESAITARRGRIRRLMLEHPVRPLPDVIEAIVNANLIVVGPGSLYTSILPNLLVDGIAATISAVNATRVYVANLMTEPGETDDYSLGDHLRAIREHTGYDLFDYVLVNRGHIPDAAVATYAADGSHVVDVNAGNLPIGRATVVTADLAALTRGGQIRHDPAALGTALSALIGARERANPAPSFVHPR
jgi:uncharacterized cofD-like protein